MQEYASAGESVRIMPVRGSEKRLPHLEELGNETLVYGDLDLKNESVVESKTKMILKTAGFQDIAPGDIIKIAFQPEELHFFDLDTGEAIRKRIPDANRANGIVSEGKLSLFGKSFDLPPALSLEDGEVEANIPLAVDALLREKKVRLTLDLEKISVKEKRRNIQIM